VISVGALTPILVCFHKLEITPPSNFNHSRDGTTALTLRAVFRLALRQSEGLIGSIMGLLEISLPVPDHTTLSRLACGLPVQMPRRDRTGDPHLIVDSTGLKLRGAGEWLFEKHGTASDAPGASCISASTPPAARSLPLT
jgi:hypothetical protein